MPADAPWLSIVMPAHNGEHWLDRTLASLSAQDCSGIELIILDSSQTPDAAAIVARHADRLEISYDHCPAIPSWTRKTNLAAERARAPFLAMLHQDDLWLPGRVDVLRAAIAAHPDAVMWLSPARIVDQDDRVLGVWRCPLRAGVVPTAQLTERLLVQNFVALPSPIFARAAWAAVGGLDESLWYTPDWDLYLRIAGEGAVVYDAEPTTAFRIHSGSLTVTGSQDGADFARQLATVIDRHIGRVPAARQATVLRTARASAQVNRSLAAAAGGARVELLRAAAAVLRLTPVQAFRFWRDTRITERVWPRVRARLAGSL